VGVKLASGVGRWSGSPTSFGYQWARCNAAGTGCVDIAGRMGSNYRTRTEDIGHTLRARVIASNAFGDGAAVLSVPSRVVTVAIPTVLSAPRILHGDAPQVAVRLFSYHGNWTGAPTGYARQWERCNAAGTDCVDIAGKTTNRYVPTSDDLGHTLRLRV